MSAPPEHARFERIYARNLPAILGYAVRRCADPGDAADIAADIPQSAGFDPSALTSTNLVLDRYQIGARLTSAVSCGWVHVWFHGTPRQKQHAAAAMATSRHWAILQEMAPEGGWSQSVWEVADFMNGVRQRNLVPGPGQTVEELAKNRVGC